MSNLAYFRQSTKLEQAMDKLKAEMRRLDTASHGVLSRPKFLRVLKQRKAVEAAYKAYSQALLTDIQQMRDQ